MKPVTKLMLLATLFIISANTQSLFAQSKADVFDQNKTITWLGLDFSQTKFIGDATQFEGEGKVTNEKFKSAYTVAWNELFITEQKKYDVAKAIHRSTIQYDIDVALKSNEKLTQKDFFSNNPGDFKKLTEQDISNVVKNYDFQNNTGTGLMFFVEGMSKGMESMGIWVTFVDMKSKTMLLTVYETSKPGGFGFRNYWAKPLYTTLKDIEDNYKSWSKN